MRRTLRFPGNRFKAMTLSYDDGVETDIRLIDIMQKNGLFGTFNLNSGAFAPEGTVYPAGQASRRMPLSQILQCYTGSGMEIATHAYTHPFLTELSPAACTYEIMADRARLENLFDTIIRGHAYPYGKYSDEVVDILRKCGIVYARTTVSTEKFELPQEPLCWHPTCHHKNPNLMPLLDKFLSMEKARTPQVFYLWGHSYEFDGADNWNVIEEFAAKAGGHGDVWYATNMEIIDYVNASKALIASADDRTLTNPTNTDLLFSVEGSGVKKPGIYEIKAGGTVHID